MGQNYAQRNKIALIKNIYILCQIIPLQILNVGIIAMDILKEKIHMVLQPKLQ